MNKVSFIVLIPALKKTVAFQDDLVKKIAGVTLVQRAINKAQELRVAKQNIHLLTDSEEIRLIAERNGIGVYWDPSLVLHTPIIHSKLDRYLHSATKQSEFILLLSPYAPLLSIGLLKQAIKALNESQKDILKPVKVVQRQLFDANEISVIESAVGVSQENHRVESKAFTIMRSHVIFNRSENNLKLLTWEVEHDLMEIDSFQDWWVCEKLLNRKRIIFRVIGNEKVGMGHIYRSLSLAHEITDHEILFVSDTENTIAVNKLVSYDYWLEIYKPDKIIEKIIKLKPDMVINDILSTTKQDVLSLQRHGIKVVNFEDLGEGASLADLTINELYDEPQINGQNILWGHNYFFVRDEFYDAKPHRFNKNVNSVLLTFGGVDQHNLSLKVYNEIKDFCQKRKIHIKIVAGPSFLEYETLASNLKGKQGVTLTQATGVISSIMETTQLSIVSNGRTIYELVHMNIPSIVISQHEREETHSFACEENGFIPLGIYEHGNTEKEVLIALEKIVDDETYRHKLFDNMKPFRFNANKQRVLRKMFTLLDQPLHAGGEN